MNMLKKIIAFITDDDELEGKHARLLSLVFLSIAAALSLAEYTREVTEGSWSSWAVRAVTSAVAPATNSGATSTAIAAAAQVIGPAPGTSLWAVLFDWAVRSRANDTPSGDAAEHADERGDGTETHWFWGKPEKHLVPFNFRPGLAEGALALALITPLYLRGLLKWKTSIYSIISYFLILLLFASFVTIALGGSGKDNVTVRGFLASAVLLSWLGIRSVAGASWIAALGSAVYSLYINSLHLEFLGFLFIATSSLGLILHSGLNPGQLFYGFATEYSPIGRQAGEMARGDVKVLGDSVKSVAKTVVEAAVTRD